jgi:hypothetical protein
MSEEKRVFVSCSHDSEPHKEWVRGLAEHLVNNGIDSHLTKTGKRRKRIEEILGWIKSSAGRAKTKFRGRERVTAPFTLALVAYNLIRLPRLLAQAPT